MFGVIAICFTKFCIRLVAVYASRCGEGNLLAAQKRTGTVLVNIQPAMIEVYGVSVFELFLAHGGIVRYLLNSNIRSTSSCSWISVSSTDSNDSAIDFNLLPTVDVPTLCEFGLFHWAD
jgi:hypothetical protein